jgi:hypothetical protein
MRDHIVAHSGLQKPIPTGMLNANGDTVDDNTRIVISTDTGPGTIVEHHGTPDSTNWPGGCPMPTDRPRQTNVFNFCAPPVIRMPDPTQCEYYDKPQTQKPMAWGGPFGERKKGKRR